MLDAWSARLHVGLTPNAVAVVRTREWPRFAVTEVRTQAWDPALRGSALEVGQALGSLFATLRCRGLNARFVLSDDLVRHWMVTPPSNARSVQDCSLAARARFLALYGESTDGWQWQADWRVDRPFLASAVPGEWSAMLHEVCAQNGLHLQSIAPEMVSVWNRWRHHLRPGHWLASASGPRITLAAFDAGGLLKIGRLAWPSDAAEQAAPSTPVLQRMVTREALRWMLDTPRRLHWWGPAPEAPRPTPAAEPGDHDQFAGTYVPLVAHRAAASLGLQAPADIRAALLLATAAW